MHNCSTSVMSFLELCMCMICTLVILVSMHMVGLHALTSKALEALYHLHVSDA